MRVLYPNVSRPLYEQLKASLKESIDSGLYQEGHPLPAERRLMEIYGVSRMTVRQAIGDLVEAGILQRKHGIGTFVVPKQMNTPVAKLYGLVEELILMGHDVSMEKLGSGVEDPTPDIARGLELNQGERVFYYERLIRSDEKPLLVTRSHMHEQMANLFDAINVNIAKDVIHNHLERCGYQISHATQHVQAGTPTAEEAAHLQCDISCPALIILRTTYLKGGYPVIYSRHVYHHSHVLTMILKR